MHARDSCAPSMCSQPSEVALIFDWNLSKQWHPVLAPVVDLELQSVCFSAKDQWTCLDAHSDPVLLVYGGLNLSLKELSGRSCWNSYLYRVYPSLLLCRKAAGWIVSCCSCQARSLLLPGKLICGWPVPLIQTEWPNCTLPPTLSWLHWAVGPASPQCRLRPIV